jgi:membrane protease YdiL (CAAX protease family)
MDTAVASPAPSGVRFVFFNERGLRAGWRLVIFYLLSIALAFPLLLWMRRGLHVGEGTPFTVELLILVDLVQLATALGATAIMGHIERRRFADYGVPLRSFFTARFFEGLAWGFATLGVIGAAVWALGGVSFDGVASGPGVVRAAGLWLVGALLIGLWEEISFRGYQLWTLQDGLGFWPAALLQSLYFGFVLHYLEKQHETLMDGFNVSLVALFFCWAVRRTGDVRFAAGWHVTFNFASFFLLGSPNTAFGGPVEPHWLQSRFEGTPWLTGGATGLEASAVATAAFVLLFPLVAWRFRRAVPLNAPASR